MKVVIIGGGSAGTTCAFELRKENKEIDITIIEKTNQTEYSPCALPYVIGGEISDFEKIKIYTEKDYKENNINLILNEEVKEIDEKNKKIRLKDRELTYDKLVIATGSKPYIPKIEGLTEYLILKTVEDAKKIEKLENKSIIIIGAGMIGLELGNALLNKNNKVIIFENQNSILPNMLDKDMASELEKLLENIEIKKEEIKQININKLITKEQEYYFDHIIIACGTGLENLNNKALYCGDCNYITEEITKATIKSHLGTSAVRQGKNVANKILNKDTESIPNLNNSITKISDYIVGSVGINTNTAINNNIKTISAKYKGTITAPYYSDEPLIVKLIFNELEEIIGGQIIGKTEVAGRLNLLSLAISKKMNIKDLKTIDTCYNPASAPIFDPITVCAEIVEKKVNALKRNYNANK